MAGHLPRDLQQCAARGRPDAPAISLGEALPSSSFTPHSLTREASGLLMRWLPKQVDGICLIRKPPGNEESQSCVSTPSQAPWMAETRLRSLLGGKAIVGEAALPPSPPILPRTPFNARPRPCLLAAVPLREPPARLVDPTLLRSLALLDSSEYLKSYGDATTTTKAHIPPLLQQLHSFASTRLSSLSEHGRPLLLPPSRLAIHQRRCFRLHLRRRLSLCVPSS